MKNIKRLFASTSFFLVSSLLIAQVPYNIGRVGEPLDFYNHHGTLLCLDYAYSHPNEVWLWKSNGTPDSTVIVKKFAPPKVVGSGIIYGKSLKNKFLFTYLDLDHGRELWGTDGTDTGTYMIKDIYTGPKNSEILEKGMTLYKGELYFSAADSAHSNELWKTDGTKEGTKLVKDIYPGVTRLSFPPYDKVANYSKPEFFAVLNDVLYFSATDSAHHTELWKSDGTEAGTTILKDIYPGLYNSSNPRYLTVFKGEIYFIAFVNSRNKWGLWKTDGTDAGTVLVKQINQDDTYQGNPYSLTAFKDNLYFWCDDGTGIGRELWKSDGTAAGTNLLMDINPTSSGSEMQMPCITPAGDYLFFWAHGKPWRTDGTENGTYALIDTVGQSDYSAAAKDGIVYFPGVTGNSTNYRLCQIWRTDGTKQGTWPVPGTACTKGLYGYSPTCVTDVDGTIFFAGCAPANEFTLWKLDNSVVTEIKEGMSKSTTLFPNPFTNSTTLKFTVPQEATTIRILDALGREIRTIKFSGTELTIEKGQLSQGIYFVQVMDPSEPIIMKMVIQ